MSIKQISFWAQKDKMQKIYITLNMVLKQCFTKATVSVWNLDAQNSESTKTQTDDSSDFRHLLASETQWTHLSKNPDKCQCYKSLLKFDFCPDFGHSIILISDCLKSGCAVKWMQTSCPKSWLIRFSDTCWLNKRWTGKINTYMYTC